MPTTAAHVDFDASPSAVMSVLVDHDRYPDFLPHIQAVEVQTLDDGAWLVTYTTRVIRDLHYTLRLRREGDTVLHWELAEEGVFLRNSGSWSLEPLPDGQTRGTHTLDIVLAVFLPHNIAKSLIERTHPATLARFRDEVQRRSGAS